ncbi:hypothetical protein JOF56_001791 [Kibdelosporangium banguiense]|uniref:Uncharacterized protein n=1 Tax=Kibdelosporangium banguiense TaxID=1365924 RepID=A0ABS4TAG2_9PSEU|nr:hypothetical protein [Kibdelosporangium banguiense]MBP2321406.1 hypothetical protein [Kibdelosporangium banguiense]
MTTMIRRPAAMPDVFGPCAEFAGLPVRDLRVEYAGCQGDDFDPDNPPVVAVKTSIPLTETEMAAVLYGVLECSEIPTITPEETRRIVTETVVNAGCMQIAEYVYEAYRSLRDGTGNQAQWQDCRALVRACLANVRAACQEVW